jgi:hypothetical protein
MKIIRLLFNPGIKSKEVFSNPDMSLSEGGM